VHELVRVAYGAPLALLNSQVVGGPPWVDVDRFEITAKIAGPTDVSNGPPVRLLELRRTLLADRFNVRVRTETRRLPVYDLDLEYTPGLGSASQPSADAKPDLFTAIREQLGLRLQSAVGDVEVIVIERAEQPASD